MGGAGEARGGRRQADPDDDPDLRTAPADARHRRPDAGRRRLARWRSITLRDIPAGCSTSRPSSADARSGCAGGWARRRRLWHGQDEGSRAPAAGRPARRPARRRRGRGSARRPARPPGRVRQGDRDKAWRPLSLEQRRERRSTPGSRAMRRGDFFAAHEALEPAWMGTDDLVERALHQGLIKVAAAYVHAVRGNPAGIVKNLAGARGHLANATAAGPAWGVDVAELLSRRRRAARRPHPHRRPARYPEDPDPMNRPRPSRP